MFCTPDKNVREMHFRFYFQTVPSSLATMSATGKKNNNSARDKKARMRSMKKIVTEAWEKNQNPGAGTTAQATTAPKCPSETTAPVGQLPQLDNCPSATTAPVRQLPQCDNCPWATTAPVRQLPQWEKQCKTAPNFFF